MHRKLRIGSVPSGIHSMKNVFEVLPYTASAEELIMGSRVDNEITGEILLNTDMDMLRELKIKSLGHRIAIYKAVQKLRLDNGYSASDLTEDTAAVPAPAVRHWPIIGTMMMTSIFIQVLRVDTSASTISPDKFEEALRHRGTNYSYEQETLTTVSL